MMGTLRTILRIANQVMRADKRPLLGRWTIERDQYLRERKIELANVDYIILCDQRFMRKEMECHEKYYLPFLQ